MITIGNQIVPLRERFGPPWSKFAFILRYRDWSILLHSLTSAMIECDEETTNRVLANQVTERETSGLKSSGLIIEGDNEDQNLITEITAKVRKKLDRTSVTTLFLIVTDYCNLSCVYCLESLQRYATGSKMDFLEMKKAVDYFLRTGRGEKTIFFYGGEPLIVWDDVKRCIEYVRARYSDRKVNLQITTNGTLRPVGFVEFCKEWRVGVAVSIDGPAQITNVTRPTRSGNLNVFERAFQLILDCRRAGVIYGALCTVSKENADRLGEITDFFIENGIVKMTFNLLVRRAGESPRENLTFWDDLGYQMSIQYRKLLEHGIFEPKALRYLSGITEGRFTIAECDAGYRGQIVAKPGGFIGPCQAFLHDLNFWAPIDSVVNVRDHEIWQRFSGKTTLETPVCGSCPFMGTCGSGCRYNRTEFGEPNPNFCQYIRSFLYQVVGQTGGGL